MSAKYSIDGAGMREFANSRMMADAMFPVAEQLASEANATGRSTYDARRATVDGGRDNSPRAGAEVVESERPSWADVNNRHLVRVTQGFRMRGGGGAGG